MSRETWKQLPPAEWKRRLNQARAIALQRLAARGLSQNVGDGDDVGSRFGYNGGQIDDLAVSLNPAIAVRNHEIDQLVVQVEGLTEASEIVCGYAIDVAETAFLFGVITGCHLSWPVIEAIPAPYAPPKKRATKGGAA